MCACFPQQKAAIFVYIFKLGTPFQISADAPCTGSWRRACARLDGTDRL